MLRPTRRIVWRWILNASIILPPSTCSLQIEYQWRECLGWRIFRFSHRSKQDLPRYLMSRETYCCHRTQIYKVIETRLELYWSWSTGGFPPCLGGTSINPSWRQQLSSPLHSLPQLQLPHPDLPLGLHQLQVSICVFASRPFELPGSIGHDTLCRCLGRHSLRL